MIKMYYIKLILSFAVTIRILDTVYSTNLNEDNLTHFQNEFQQMKITFSEIRNQSADISKRFKALESLYNENILILKSKMRSLEEKYKISIQERKGGATITTMVMSGNNSVNVTQEDEEAKVLSKVFLEYENTEVGPEVSAEHGDGTVAAGKGGKIRTTLNISNHSGGSGHVAFDASLGHNVGDLGHEEIIKFDHVTFNPENVYNPNSGIFVCDRTGTYVFYVRFHVVARKSLHAELVKNGASFSYMYTRNEDTWGHSSNLAIQHLYRGDRVWVQTREYQDTPLTGTVLDANLCSFAGFLLYSGDL